MSNLFLITSATLFQFKAPSLIILFIICSLTSLMHQHSACFTNDHFYSLVTVTDKSCTGNSSQYQPHCVAFWDTLFVKVVLTSKIYPLILLRDPCVVALFLLWTFKTINRQMDLWYMKYFMYAIRRFQMLGLESISKHFHFS